MRVVVPGGATEGFQVRDTVRVSGRAPVTTVRYYLSRDAGRDRGDRRLAGGRGVSARAQAGRARVKVPRGAAPGSYYVLACADDTERVSERDERNNCRRSASRLELFARFRPRPLHVKEKLAPARAASAQIGPEGGSLSARAPDGTAYTLTVPPEALAAATQIKMTPIVKIGGIPGADRLGGAVRLGPDGLAFNEAATLTIRPAKRLPVSRQLPFASANGRNFHAYPILPDRSAIRLPLLHFTSFGTISLGPSATDVVFRRVPSDRLSWAEQNLAQALRKARQSDNPRTRKAFLEAAEVALFILGNEHVRPLIDSAKNRASRSRAIQAFISWQRQIQLLLGEDLDDGSLSRLLAELSKKIVTILEAQFEDDLSRCQREPFAAFVDAFSTARQLSLLGVDAPEQRAYGCLRFELTMTTTTTLEHTPTDSTFSSSARAVVPIDLLGAPAASVPLEGVGQTGDPTTQGCTWLAKGLHPTVFEIVGLSLAGGGESFLDRVRAGAFRPEDLTIAFRPGELGERWSTVCGGMESDEGTYPEVYKLAFELLHGSAPTVTGFARVAGSVWAAEVRFDRRQTAPTTEVRGEQTRFFLRSTPQTAP